MSVTAGNLRIEDMRFLKRLHSQSEPRCVPTSTWLCELKRRALQDSRGPWAHQAEYFVVKRYDGGKESAEFYQFERQAAVSTMLESKGWIPLVAYDLDGEPPNLIYPWRDLPTWDEWALSKNQAPSRHEIFGLARRLFDALHALHACGFVHTDLRPEHVLIDPQSRVKLVGLGSCNPVGTLCQRKSFNAYHAPETLKSEHVASSAQDIYSAAQLLQEQVGPQFAQSNLARAMRADSPWDRPTAGELSALMRSASEELPNRPHPNPASAA